MGLRAYDPQQTFTWQHSGVECTLRPLTAREMAEVQATSSGLAILGVAQRGLWSIKGDLMNVDGSLRELVREPTPSGRGIVPEEFFDGLPMSWWQEMAFEILRRSKVEEADQKNS